MRCGHATAFGWRPASPDPSWAQTPKDVVWRRGRSELWHYRNDNVRVSPPLLIVFSLFSRSYILDLQPGNSFVERLLDAGFDVYLLDWGVPDERDAANQLEDYVDDYLPAAVERVRQSRRCRRDQSARLLLRQCACRCCTPPTISTRRYAV